MRNVRTRLVRFADSSGKVHTGLTEGETVRPLPAELRIADVLKVRVDQLDEVFKLADGEIPVDEVRLLAPVDGLTEVWCAGVTYERSRVARGEESSEATVYDRVYEAERPELFFKAPAWRVVTDGEPIAVREDSSINVPEPELGLVINAFSEIMGYVVVNDVSSRAIEGENPLYLPQAKVYAGSCAISAGIVPVWLTGIESLEIEMRIWRAGEAVFEGSTSTEAFHRPPAGLVPYLTNWLEFPEGAILATGTGIVPDLDFDLQQGDTVEIRIANVGSLTNTVLGVQPWLESHG